MTAPLVSVVLPVYDREAELPTAMRSVLGQTHQDLELIVVDDASRDDSYGVARSFAGDPRVTVVRNARNAGAGAARNRGAAIARGRLLAFQDSDDRWFPEKLERQLAVMRASPGARVAYCGAVYFSPNQCYAIPRPEATRKTEGDLSRELLFTNPTTPQTLLIDRDLFEEAGGFDGTLGINEDWDLALRLAQRTTFAFVPDPLVLIVRTANSRSSDRIADARFRIALVDRYGALFGGEPAARGRQLYVAGSMLLQEGRPREAFVQLCRSFGERPTMRSLLKLLRAGGLAALRHEVERTAD